MNTLSEWELLVFALDCGSYPFVGGISDRRLTSVTCTGIDGAPADPADRVHHQHHGSDASSWPVHKALRTVSTALHTVDN